MSLTTIHARAPRAFTRLAGALAVTVALLLGTASAQQLTNLLPQESFAVMGVSGISQHEAKFQPFVNEWQRLGLTELFTEAFPEDEEFDVDEAVPAEFANLDLFDVLGNEAWLAVSASRTNPLPAFSGVARVSPEAAAALQTVLDREAGEGEFQTLTEGAIEFRVGASDEFDEPMAYAIDGTFVAFSSNPDVLRGVLRRYQGAVEPSFVDSRGYADTVAPLLPSNAVVYFDLPQIVDLAEPFVTGMGFDASVARLARALRTFGSYASVTRITNQGLETLSMQVLGDPSLDPELYSLLSTNVPVSPTAQAFVSGNTVSYQAAGANVSGWWNYISGLAGDLPELGIGNLDTFIAQNVGIDLNQMLFSWMGSTFAMVTPFTTVADIGMTPENMLGDSLYLIATSDAAAADQGLEMLISMGSMMAGAFLDPYGEGGGMPTAPATRTVAGVSVDTYDIGEGVVIEVAITGGYVVVATSSSAMDDALQAHAAGGALPPVLAGLAGNVPLGAGNVLLQDGAASFRLLGQTLTSQFGLFAGLAGDIDFDAAEQASDGVAQFIEFLANKAGGQFSYGVADGGVLRGYSLTGVDW
ncbi:MAG: DUF3352 domain-containing protein [Trueperaceae bacterium]